MVKSSKASADNADRENPVWTDSDFSRARRVWEIAELAHLSRRSRGERGPQKAPTKEQVTLRLDRDVLARFRATGTGWQSRINAALRKAKV